MNHRLIAGCGFVLLLIAGASWLHERAPTASAATPPVEPLAIEGYARPEDKGDWALAFERLQRAPECAAGCTVQLARAKYQVMSTIDICRPMTILGQGSWDDTARTKIVSTGTTAIAFRYRPWCVLRGLGTGSQGAEMRGLSITEVAHAASWPSQRVGVLVSAPISIRDAGVSGFYTGLRVDAGAKRGDLTNANLVRADHVWVKNTSGPGVFVDGPDANAGLFTSVSVIHACKGALAGAFCAGVIDSSFLGNTWEAPHVADAASNAGVPFPAYWVDGADNRSVFIGAYAEEDCATSIAGPVSMVLGGKSAWRAGGLVASGRTISGATLLAPTIASNPANPQAVSRLARYEIRGKAGETITWWEQSYDGRPTSAQAGWTRTLWKGSSSNEMNAWSQTGQKR